MARGARRKTRHSFEPTPFAAYHSSEGYEPLARGTQAHRIAESNPYDCFAGLSLHRFPRSSSRLHRMKAPGEPALFPIPLPTSPSTMTQGRQDRTEVRLLPTTGTESRQQEMEPRAPSPPRICGGVPPGSLLLQRAQEACGIHCLHGVLADLRPEETKKPAATRRQQPVKRLQTDGEVRLSREQWKDKTLRRLCSGRGALLAAIQLSPGGMSTLSIPCTMPLEAGMFGSMISAGSVSGSSSITK